MQQLRREIQQINNETFNSYLRTMTSDQTSEYSLRKATKRIKKPTTQIPPIQNGNGTWAKSNKQKADVFAEYLEQTFKPNEKQRA